MGEIYKMTCCELQGDDIILRQIKIIGEPVESFDDVQGVV